LTPEGFAQAVLEYREGDRRGDIDIGLTTQIAQLLDHHIAHGIFGQRPIRSHEFANECRPLCAVDGHLRADLVALLAMLQECQFRKSIEWPNSRRMCT
jgi:hypothetical protein